MTNSDSKQDFELKKVTLNNQGYIEKFYKWNCNENQLEHYTCRPVHKYFSFEEYNKSIITHMQNGVRLYALKSINEENKICGKVSLFDYNPRNYSAEFGYYLPQKYRGQGLGTTMVKLFLKHIFSNKELNIHKIYATTASGNNASIRLLESFGFHLDGKLRDHYWIGNNIQDQFHYSLLKKEWGREL